jgi:putative phage-type endonuclease
MEEEKLPEELSEEEWLARRKQGLGGTDVAAIVGVNPYRAPFDVYCEKMGLVDAQPPNDQMEYGRHNEAFALRLYRKYSGHDNTLTLGRRLFHHSDIPLWLGTPDAIVPHGGPGVEAKTASYYQQKLHWGEPGTDEVPDWYRIQVEWYMPLVSRDVFDFAAWFAGTNFEMYRVTREEVLLEQLAEAAKRFWRDHILAQHPPPMGAGAAAEAYLRKMFPTELSMAREATPDEEAALMQLWQARATTTTAQQIEDALENQVKALIGEAAGIEGRLFRALWKRTKDGTSVNWKAIARELNAPEDLVRRHSEPRPGVRRFTFNEKEEK